MKTFFLLIILTQNGAGDINASFVNTETLEQCRQKALMVEGVFKGSNIPVIESRCIRSDLTFTEFSHASSSGMIRNFYLVHVDDVSIDIKQMPDWQSCNVQEKLGVEQGKVFCSSSVQSLE
jgi:hypothetical protein